MSQATKAGATRSNPNLFPSASPKARPCRPRFAESKAVDPASSKGSPRSQGRVRSAFRVVSADDHPTVEAPGFTAFAEDVRRELAPEGLLESATVELVARAAFGEGDAQDLSKALEALASIRALKATTWGRPGPAPAPQGVSAPPAEPLDDPARAFRVAAYHVEGLGLSFDEDDEAHTEAAASEEPDGRWRDRLIFDPEVSNTSPVVRGTWITVSQVVSKVVDGWSWSEILRDFPELIEDDVRACLAYAVEQDDLDAVA